MMEAVLTCSALTKAYGPNKALDNFTAVFSGGRITGLLGPNGSGKTTLMKLAPGPQTKARVAYLPERTYLPAGLRVREALELFCDFYADFSREKAVSMLADLKIQPGDKISAMSKGTREKVQLVLVMSRAAGLYLLDEPEAALSPQRQLTLLLEIYRLAQAHAQFILVTHSPILLGLPGAELLSLDGNALRPIAYTDTESYQVTRMFIEQREGLLKKLLEE